MIHALPFVVFLSVAAAAPPERVSATLDELRREFHSFAEVEQPVLVIDIIDPSIETSVPFLRDDFERMAQYRVRIVDRPILWDLVTSINTTRFSAHGPERFLDLRYRFQFYDGDSHRLTLFANRFGIIVYRGAAFESADDRQWLIPFLESLCENIRP